MSGLASGKISYNGFSMSAKLTCPECQQPITPNTTKCPHCKKKVSKKHIRKYENAISKFWVAFLGTFLVLLTISFILYDYLGATGTGIAIFSALPISFLIGYFVKRFSLKS